MNIEKKRLANLRQILKTKFKNNVTKMSIAVEKKQPYIHGIVNENRPFKEDLARHIEKKLNLPYGYLDESDNNITTSYIASVLIACNNKNIYYPLSSQELQDNKLNQENLLVLVMPNDSMEPLIMKEQYILINKAENDIIDNKIYAIKINNETHIKRLFKNIITGNIIISSDNFNYKDIEITTDQLTIIGRVVLLLSRPV